MCFFLQTLKGFNNTYPGLFGKGNDEHGSDGEPGESASDGFIKRYGWIYSTEQVRELIGGRTTLDDIDEMKIVYFLNMLSYLKAKGQHEKALIKEWQGKS